MVKNKLKKTYKNSIGELFIQLNLFDSHIKEGSNVKKTQK
jgi:hypothetical protein